MNASFNAQQAYAASQSPVRTDRSSEAQLIGQVTSDLRKSSRLTGPSAFTRMTEALHRNNRMWTLFAAELADDANALPKDLRARLFFLAEFTKVHTGKVLAGNATVDALIDINTAVMRGLTGKTGL